MGKIIEQYLDAIGKMGGGRNWEFKNMYDFLTQKGTAFVNIHDFNKTGYNHGQPGNCYKNCIDLALTHKRVVYCEGIAVPTGCPLPLAHAWCYTTELGVIDPTWEEGVEYFGVVIPIWYVTTCTIKSGYYGVIDSWKISWPILTGAHKWPLDEEQVKSAGWNLR